MMNEEYIKRLDFDSDTFEAMKTDMNFILQRMIGSMIEKDSTENAPDSPETDENGSDNISSADEDNDAEIDATEALFGTDGDNKEGSDEPGDDYGYDEPEEE